MERATGIQRVVLRASQADHGMAGRKYLGILHRVAVLGAPHKSTSIACCSVDTTEVRGPNDYQTCGVYAQIGQLERTWSSDHRLDEAESVHGWNQSPDRGDRVTDSSKTVRLPATLA